MFIFACAVTKLVLLGKEDPQESGPGNPDDIRQRTFIDAIRQSPSSIVVVVICFFSVWSIIGLTGFHTFLTSTNLTTNEDIKGSYSSKRNHENFNPFSSGNMFANCLDVLCSPVNPSLLDSRGYVTEQYLVSNNLGGAASVEGGASNFNSEAQSVNHAAAASAAMAQPGRSYGAVMEPTGKRKSNKNK